MKALHVFNNGLTEGKIFLSNCLRAAMDNGELWGIIYFLRFKGGVSITRQQALQYYSYVNVHFSSYTKCLVSNPKRYF